MTQYISNSRSIFTNKFLEDAQSESKQFNKAIYDPSLSKRVEDSTRSESTDPQYEPMGSDTPEDSQEVNSEEMYRNAGIEPEDYDIGEEDGNAPIEETTLDESDHFAPEENNETESLEQLEDGTHQEALDETTLGTKLAELSASLTEEQDNIPKPILDELSNELTSLQSDLAKAKDSKNKALILEKVSQKLSEIESTILDYSLNNVGKDYNELSTLITSIENKLSDPNISASKQEAYKTQLTEFKDRIEANPRDAETILTEAKQLEKTVNTDVGEFTTEEILSSRFNLDPAEIKDIMKKHHLDEKKISRIDNNLLEALKEINPKLAELEEQLIEAQKVRKEKEAEAHTNAKAIDDSNMESTSNNDNLDIKDFIYLAKSRKRQTDEATQVQELRNKIREEMVNTLQELMPDKKISIVKEKDTSKDTDIYHMTGKSNAEFNYESADQITVSGRKISLTNKNGEIAMNNEADSIEDLVTWHYDWDGAGDFEDRNGGQRGELKDYGVDYKKYDTGGDYNPFW